MKREWSKKVMRNMLDQSRLGIRLADLKRLSIVEFNELGDWLYYYVHFTEKDSRYKRAVPKIVSEIT